MGVHLRRDVPGTRKGNFAVENGVGHGVAGFHHGVHGIEIRVQLVQVDFQGVHVPIGRQYLHHLDVVAVVMPPAPNLPVHVFHFPVVGLDQLPLIGRNALVDLFGKERHS